MQAFFKYFCFKILPPESLNGKQRHEKSEYSSERVVWVKTSQKLQLLWPFSGLYWSLSIKVVKEWKGTEPVT